MVFLLLMKIGLELLMVMFVLVLGDGILLVIVVIMRLLINWPVKMLMKLGPGQNVEGESVIFLLWELIIFLNLF